MWTGPDRTTSTRCDRTTWPLLEPPLEPLLPLVPVPVPVPEPEPLPLGAGAGGRPPGAVVPGVSQLFVVGSTLAGGAANRTRSGPLLELLLG